MNVTVRADIVLDPRLKMNYFQKQNWLGQSISAMLNEVRRIWDKYKLTSAQENVSLSYQCPCRTTIFEWC